MKGSLGTPGQLAMLMEELSLDHVQVAKHLRVHEGAVRHWLNGRRAVPGYALAYLRLLRRYRKLKKRV